MAQRSWYRKKLKRSPVAGCCFLLALSVVAITSLSPALLVSYKETDFQYLPMDESRGKTWSKCVGMNSTGSVAQQAWCFGHRKYPNAQSRQVLQNPNSVCKQKSKPSSQNGHNLRGLRTRRKFKGQIKRHNVVLKSSEHSKKHAGYPSRISHERSREFDALKNAGQKPPFYPDTRKEVDCKPQRELASMVQTLQVGNLGALLHPKNLSVGQLALPQELCKPDVQTAGAEHKPTDLIKAIIADQQSFQRMTGTPRWMDNIRSQNSEEETAHFGARDLDRLQKSEWCIQPQDSGSGGRQEGRLRFGKKIPPWFSRDDMQKMKLLANGAVVNKNRIPAHGQILRVALLSKPDTFPHDSKRLCSNGQCGLIKRPSDLYEVLAFHLDRVLGLHRSLPVVARKFSSHLLPYKYTNGAIRPIVWWAADIQHLNDSNNDQNSFALGWEQYQQLLRQRCGMEDSRTTLGKAPCLTVLHSEWAKLALFDFLLQVHDRLDRYCCGFQPDSSEPCIQEMLHEKCRNPTELVLVHIMIRKSKPSHLVFIDNAGRPLHPEAKLNFRLLDGIDGFPATAVTVLKSGCLQNMLLQSLSMDEEFWDSQGGYDGLRHWLQTIDRRGQILLQYIQKHNLTIFKDSSL